MVMMKLDNNYNLSVRGRIPDLINPNTREDRQLKFNTSLLMQTNYN